MRWRNRGDGRNACIGGGLVRVIVASVGNTGWTDVGGVPDGLAEGCE